MFALHRMRKSHSELGTAKAELRANITPRMVTLIVADYLGFITK
jgi:hypothetical protein